MHFSGTLALFLPLFWTLLMKIKDIIGFVWKKRFKAQVLTQRIKFARCLLHATILHDRKYQAERAFGELLIYQRVRKTLVL
jgi:hypothetical protein